MLGLHLVLCHLVSEKLVHRFPQSEEWPTSFLSGVDNQKKKKTELQTQEY